MPNDFDIIVIGGGHAGAEAAWAAGRLGARTALITFDPTAIGRMSCNPAIGGIGKGQMVREIDALGGVMGLATDRAGIQFRLLNRRKGPAMWSPRAQCDRDLYAAAVQNLLSGCPNLVLIAGAVEDIEVGAASSARPDWGPIPKQVTGVALQDGRRLSAQAVIVTSGTFMRGLMHTGEQKTTGGRVGEPAASGLSGSLGRLGLSLGRLKTGTPPRVQRDSINYSKLAEQPGDANPAPFSYLTDRLSQPMVPCWITFTSPESHALIRENLHRAPMYSGQIHSRGPRYCPSIEDKVVRFADKDRHQVFLEPEGYQSDRVYLNGISTSLPADVQERLVRGIEGLENARILQWGYAVEYDFVPPHQIDATLMTRGVGGLFLAGQVNGTSGYEEAAGQGLVAGINAARFAAGLAPFTLKRDEAYIGVMIDDLVTQTLSEPYRMFTSRAEHRLHLRYDNADARLTPLGRSLGLVDDARWQRFEVRRQAISELRQLLAELRFEGKPIDQWWKRPDEEAGAVWSARFPALAPYFAQADVWGCCQIDIKYAGYLDRQQREREHLRRYEEEQIPPELDFAQVLHLRRESVERWAAARPRTLGQAARVAGIHPTDVTLLMIELSRRRRQGANTGT